MPAVATEERGDDDCLRCRCNRTGDERPAKRRDVSHTSGKAKPTLRRGAVTRTVGSALAICLVCLAVALTPAMATPNRAASTTRVLTFSYRSSAGPVRTAYLVLPAWYGPLRHPPIPVVISPHGRGVSGSYNLRFWGDLPGRGPFALISPDGQGRRLPFYSWGYAGQIDDLARMQIGRAHV